MVRPLRLEYAGALYHVTSRGDRREEIYRDDSDRRQWLEVLGSVCDRFNWVVHAYHPSMGAVPPIDGVSSNIPTLLTVSWPIRRFEAEND